MSGPVTGLKKLRINVRAAHGSEFGRYGKSRNGESRPRVHILSIARFATVLEISTSRLHLDGASSQQLLHLLRGNRGS